MGDHLLRWMMEKKISIWFNQGAWIGRWMRRALSWRVAQPCDRSGAAVRPTVIDDREHHGGPRRSAAVEVDQHRHVAP